MAEALKPLFGETPEQRAQRQKGWNLSEKDKLECWRLDGKIQVRRVIASEEVSLYQASKTLQRPEMLKKEGSPPAPNRHETCQVSVVG